MQNLSLQPISRAEDLAAEIARIERLLDERRRELASLQEEMRAFRTLYTRIIGSRLAELSEIERAIREAERRLLGVSDDGEDEATSDPPEAQPETRMSLRKIFWTIAKMFHPDHAANPQEAARRHSIMAEASRAYREGDVESLHSLLADERLQSYCASARRNEADDPKSRLLDLKEELITIEFGIKRIKGDALYRIKLKVDDAARQGRDALAEMAEDLDRQIAKARRRLAHLS
jgi:hypothetical protein